MSGLPGSPVGSMSSQRVDFTPLLERLRMQLQANQFGAQLQDRKQARASEIDLAKSKLAQSAQQFQAQLGEQRAGREQQAALTESGRAMTERLRREDEQRRTSQLAKSAGAERTVATKGAALIAQGMTPEDAAAQLKMETDNMDPEAAVATMESIDRWAASQRSTLGAMEQSKFRAAREARDVAGEERTAEAHRINVEAAEEQRQDREYNRTRTEARDALDSTALPPMIREDGSLMAPSEWRATAERDALALLDPTDPQFGAKAAGVRERIQQEATTRFNEQVSAWRANTERESYKRGLEDREITQVQNAMKAVTSTMQVIGQANITEPGQRQRLDRLQDSMAQIMDRASRGEISGVEALREIMPMQAEGVGIAMKSSGVPLSSDEIGQVLQELSTPEGLSDSLRDSLAQKLGSNGAAWEAFGQLLKLSSAIKGEQVGAAKLSQLPGAKTTEDEAAGLTTEEQQDLNRVTRLAENAPTRLGRAIVPNWWDFIPGIGGVTSLARGIIALSTDPAANLHARQQLYADLSNALAEGDSANARNIRDVLATLKKYETESDAAKMPKEDAEKIRAAIKALQEAGYAGS